MPVSRKKICSGDCVQTGDLRFDGYFYGAVLQRDKPNLIYGVGSGNLRFFCNGKEYPVARGNGRWRAELPPMPSVRDCLLKIANDESSDTAEVSFGDVFLLAGQSNMEWTVKQCRASRRVCDESPNGTDGELRLYNAPCDYCFDTRDELAGNVRWTSATAETAENFSCLGYLFGKFYKARVNVPVGLVATAIGGTSLVFWQKREVQTHLEEQGVTVFTDSSQPIFTPSLGYNALINPLTANSYKAVLWYQGESNSENELHYVSYGVQLEALIKSWRTEFDDSSLDFVLFQLARFKDNQKGFREVNRQLGEVALSVEGCYLVLNDDLGEWDNIHPNDKVTPALRAVDAYLSQRKRC